MNIQICLVSAQAAPNLLPAIDSVLKPQKIVLVTTSKMRKRASDLTKVLKENGIQVEQVALGNEQNYHQTENELRDLATQLEGHQVTLNITGGTKLMSVAAQSVAATSEWRMFYVDADTDQVIWLGENAADPLPLQHQLRLRHYLQSYGFSFTAPANRASVSALQQELTQTLVQQANSLENSISLLNALAQEAENRRSLSVLLSDAQRDSRSLDVLLQHFEHAQALQVEGNTIHFPSTADRDFVKGGWLECHALQAVHQVTGALGIRDKAIGLEVIDDGTGTKNEMDIAFMARNRLFVIECKTSRIDKPQGNSDKSATPKANDALFKLAENCRRIGGLGTRGMLLSYRRLREPEMQLASALGITVVAGSNLAQLPEKLKNWVQPQQ